MSRADAKSAYSTQKPSYLTLYRRFRPEYFTDVVGQEHVTRTLQNALVFERVSHAYLFSGLRGTGKTTMAKLLARALNCEEGINQEPCGRCRACKEIMEGRSFDVMEIDAASNRGIDEIRDLREKVRYAAAENRYKVYIIDEVHMLTNEAFNALLKTLEEPPPQVVFILATTEVHKVPLTIISRCQRFDFHLLEAAQVAEHLRKVSQEMSFSVDEETLYLLARQAEGSVRDALGLLEQCRAYGGEGITHDEALEILGLASPEVVYNLLQSVVDENIAAGLGSIKEVIYCGRDLHRFLRELILYLRKLLVLISGTSEEEALRDVPALSSYLREHREKFNSAVLLEMLEILHDLNYQLKSSSQPQFLLELAFMRLIRAYRFRDYLSPGKLLQRLEEMEEKLVSASSHSAASPVSTGGEKKSSTEIEKNSPGGGEEEGSLTLEGKSASAEEGNSTLNEEVRNTSAEEGKSALAEEEKNTSAEEEKSAPVEGGGGDSEAADKAEKADLSPEELRSFWFERLLPALQQEGKHSIHSYITTGYPYSLKSGIFTLVMPDVFRRSIESNKKYLKELLYRLLGKEVSIRLIYEEGSDLGAGYRKEAASGALLSPSSGKKGKAAPARSSAPQGSAAPAGKNSAARSPAAPPPSEKGKKPSAAGSGKARRAGSETAQDENFFEQVEKIFNGRLIDPEETKGSKPAVFEE